MIGKLPSGWTVRKLGGKAGIAQVLNGATPSTDEPSFWGGDIRWVTPTDIGKLDSIFISETERNITEAGYKSCSTTMVPPNSILMTSRAPVGNMAINTVPMCTNQGFKSIVPKGEIDVYYLFYYLQRIVAQIQKDSHGNTFTEIGKGKVEDIDVPVPPTLAEQQNIAQRLNDQFSIVTGLVAAAENQLEAANALKQSMLRGVFNF